MKKWYIFTGLIAPLCYIAAVIVGGSIVENYNHIYNTISELTASDVPVIPSVYLLFALYNAMLLCFGLGARLDKTGELNPRSRTSFSLLAVISLVGLVMTFFPQDPRDAAMTAHGKVHIILAGIASLLTMVSMAFAAIGFKAMPRFAKASPYSWISLAVVFITGGAAAAGVTAGSRFGGLFERLTIGTFIQWVFVIALMMLTAAGRTAATGKTDNYRA